MDWLKAKAQTILKYKYVVLIIVIGVVFMLIPSRNKNTETKLQLAAHEQITDEEALKQILQMKAECFLVRLQALDPDVRFLQI